MRFFNSKKALTILSIILTLISLTFSVFADSLVDMEFDVSTAVKLDPWGHHDISMSNYDTTKITPSSEVLVTFEYEDIAEDDKFYDPAGTYKTEFGPVELIVQSWSNPDTPTVNSSGGVWAKVAPKQWDDTSAVFSYDDMVAAYGTNDFSGVDSLNFGATQNVRVVLKSFVITNCEKNMFIERTDAELAEHYKNLLIIVLASALGIIVILIIVFIIIIKKKSSYTYDAKTGKFVKK